MKDQRCNCNCWKDDSLCIVSLYSVETDTGSSFFNIRNEIGSAHLVQHKYDKKYSNGGCNKFSLRILDYVQR